MSLTLLCSTTVDLLVLSFHILLLHTCLQDIHKIQTLSWHFPDKNKQNKTSSSFSFYKAPINLSEKALPHPLQALWTLCTVTPLPQSQIHPHHATDNSWTETGCCQLPIFICTILVALNIQSHFLFSPLNCGTPVICTTLQGSPFLWSLTDYSYHVSSTWDDSSSLTPHCNLHICLLQPMEP